jgi:hypothetical protein
MSVANVFDFAALGILVGVSVYFIWLIIRTPINERTLIKLTLGTLLCWTGLVVVFGGSFFVVFFGPAAVIVVVTEIWRVNTELSAPIWSPFILAMSAYAIAVISLWRLRNSLVLIFGANIAAIAALLFSLPYFLDAPIHRAAKKCDFAREYVHFHPPMRRFREYAENAASLFGYSRMHGHAWVVLPSGAFYRWSYKEGRFFNHEYGPPPEREIIRTHFCPS